MPFALPEVTEIVQLELHPWGGVAFVNRGSKTQRINLESGDPLPDAGGAEDWPREFEFTPNGPYIVGRRAGISPEVCVKDRR